MKILLFNVRYNRLAAAGFLVVSAAVVFSYIILIAAELPSRDELKARLDHRNSARATEIFDRNGIKIGEIASEKRYYIPIEKIPVHVRRAFIAIEDKSFYRHSGIDPLAIVRAAFANLRGKNLQGASTITQQVARLHFLDQKKTVRRKIKEALLAGMIERNLSKNKILEVYLNKVFLGNNSYGVESAARNYFRKSVGQLNIAEAAIIAGLPKAPSKLAPNRNFAAARERAKIVLKRMHEDGYISQSSVRKWHKAPLTVAKGPMQQNSDTAFFIDEIRKDLSKKFESSDIALRGLKIVTTLDSRLQTAAADAVKANLSRNDFGGGAGSGTNTLNDIQAALVTIDPKSGDVLAMQGSSDFNKSQFNRVMSTRRNIGSAHLPFLAAAVLKLGYSMQSFPGLMDIVLNDLTYESGTILESIGIGTYVDFSKSVGIPMKQRSMSIALGVNQVTPMQLASAYGVFANDGVRVEPRLIHSVFGEDGKVLYQSQNRVKMHGARVLPTQVVAAINNILQLKGQSAHPTPTGPETDARAGGRTGSSAFAATTSSSESATDAWSISYNPKAVTVVWMGSDHGRVKLAADQFMAANRVNSVWQNYWANIPREVKKSAELFADFPAISGPGASPEAGPVSAMKISQSKAPPSNRRK